ncbi:MAG: hypothetical protein HYY01_10125 [Chloroflexi bacterium]|nr:hypothetical protein [Chloroflexota bacterium]
MTFVRFRSGGLRLTLAALAIGAVALLGATAVAGVSGKSGGGGQGGGGAGGQSGTTLNAYKTAEGYWVRRLDYDWSVAKQATPTSLEIKRGETESVQYTITATRSGPAQTDVFGVTGQVCVTNGGGVATQGLKIVDQVQYQTGGGPYQAISGASQTIIPPLQLGPGETGCYDYAISFAPVAGATYRNTAKVTITNHSGYLREPFGPEVKADFGLPTSHAIVEVDNTAMVDDVQAVPPGFAAQTAQAFPVSFSQTGQVSFTKQVTNTSASCGQYAILGNTATLTEGTTGQTRQSAAQVRIYTGDCPTPTPVPTATPTPGTTGQGCTPGYWKNHTSVWVGYWPSQTVTSVFVPAAPYVSPVDTLLDALGYKGGKTAQGAAQSLLRSGVAALLNASNPAVNYPRTTGQILSDVNSALSSGDRNTMMSLASTLDLDNNLGCPLR